MGTVSVALGPRSYPVHVSSRRWERKLTRAVRTAAGGQGRLFVISDAQVYTLFGGAIGAAVKKAVPGVFQLVVPSGERTKSKSQLHRIHSFLLRQQLERSDFILACGGGVTSDLVGFAAATALRGVRWGVVSTTLLGMVDAAIGGKTGINHTLGKNLIGAIWQPSFVICDTQFLMTLPRRHVLAGMGEVVKYGGLVGGAMLSALERFLDDGRLLNERRLSQLILLSAQYKAGVVSRDERESGRRMVLNLGHTFGHALEKSLGYGRLYHGEAVLIGLLAAIELSGQLKSARTARLARYREVVRCFVKQLPRRRVDIADTMAAMAIDKKRSHHRMRFVLLDAPGRPIIADNVSKAAVRKALRCALECY